MRTYKIFADATIEASDINDALRKLAAHLTNVSQDKQTPSPLNGCLIMCPPEELNPNRDATGALIPGECFVD